MNTHFSLVYDCSSFYQVVTVGGHKVRAMRLSFVGELGWELHAPNSAALDVYKELMRVGRELGLRNSGYRAMDSLSIEKGKLYERTFIQVFNSLTKIVILRRSCRFSGLTCPGQQDWLDLTLQVTFLS